MNSQIAVLTTQKERFVKKFFRKVPKRGRKVIYGKFRREIVGILRRLEGEEVVLSVGGREDGLSWSRSCSPP